jgi:hypothetical protein
MDAARHTCVFWSSLKEPLESRASWRVFFRTFSAKAEESFVLLAGMWFREGVLIVTVMVFEVFRAVLFLAAAPLSIPS